MIDKYEILSVVAPIAAPAAPATMLVSILYSDLIRESVTSIPAMVAAVASGIGAEASGMIAAYVGIQAYRKQKYGLMMVAILSFVVYAVFMAWGISAAQNPRTMVSTIVISIIAYLAVGTFTDLRGSTQEAQAETDMQIKKNESERKLQNSRNRGMKLVGGNTSENIGKLPENSEPHRVRWNEVKPGDYEWIAKSRTADIVARYDIDERTARNWRENAKR